MHRTNRAGICKMSTQAPVSSSSFESVLYEPDSNTRVIHLNRPKKLNSLNLEMVRDLTKKIQHYEYNENVATILMKGMGDRAFCAGGDVADLRANAMKDETRGLAQDFVREEYRLNYLLATLDTPVISYLNGITMGGGVGLSLHGKFVVATEKTTFAMPETAIGFFPDVGTSFLLPRIGRQLLQQDEFEPIVSPSDALKGQGLGTYLALSGERVKGEEVIGLGLATHYIPTEHFENLQTLLSEMDVHNLSPEDRDDLISETLEQLEGDESFQEPNPEYLETVEDIFGATNKDDTIEGIFKRLQEHNSDWSKQTLATLKKMSPLSLKVTLKEMREGANMNYMECFQMDYRIACRMFEKSDLLEGVRSVVVDKDHNPKWLYKDVAAVPKEEVERFFEPLPEEQELTLYASEKIQANL